MALLAKFKSRKKGFFSIDALFAIILLLLVTSTLINLYQGRAQMVEGSRKKMEGKMISEKLAKAINTVYTSRKPLSMELDLPENVLDQNYTIEFHKDSRNISLKFSDGGNSSKYTATPVVVDELEISEPLDFSQKIMVHWINNEIKVENP